ncbi:MAG: carboxypeptidase regulatory-like domain-containing protein [Vicinamibacterales bacterium]
MCIVLGAADVAVAQGPAPQAPMNMANMDRRGGIRGTVRGADSGPAADTVVIAADAANGARFTATSDAQGAYAFAALPVGTYNITVVSAGLTAFRRQAVAVAADQNVQLDIALDAASAGQAADLERQELLQQLAELKDRVTELESNTVLSEPETRVRRVEVFVDANGNETDVQVPGSRPAVTYRRERVYRRQTINEKIEEALADAEEHSVRIGVDAAITTQFAKRTKGNDPLIDKHAYALASADLFFTAGIAQNTIFFADIVALSGAPPDAEIPSLTLLNGYTARLVRQNELNLREVWLRTELFGQRLALTTGRLDLTNYFDQNALANDESTQFLSDALVNNQMLGLSSNGTGIATEFDAKNGFRFKFGLQQSNTDATNLSDSMYTLSEVGYTFTPFALPEGTYRAWFRTDNTSDDIRKGVGVSVDQKLTNALGLFARYGSQDLEGDGRDHYWSAGVGFQNGFIFNPQDTWGVGYAQMSLRSGDREKLIEAYYNVLLTEKLRLSFNLTHALETPAVGEKFGYLLPGVRLQAAF